jgi:hypothetical protein
MARVAPASRPPFLRCPLALAHKCWPTACSVHAALERALQSQSTSQASVHLRENPAWEAAHPVFQGAPIDRGDLHHVDHRVTFQACSAGRNRDVPMGSTSSIRRTESGSIFRRWAVADGRARSSEILVVSCRRITAGIGGAFS